MKVFCYIVSFGNWVFESWVAVWPPFFCHSIFVTHHSKIPCLFGTITHFPSLNIFHTICESHTCHPMHFFFFLVPKLTEPSEKKQKQKKKPKTWRSNQWKKKKKSKGGQKLRLSTVCGSPFVCLITIFSLSYELWKLRIELRKQAIQIASESQEVTRVSYSSFIEKKISVKSF